LRVVVTGGAGFIGYWTVREFLRFGHEVRVVDNLSRASFSKQLVEMGVELRRVDVRDLPSLKDALKGCDAVIHLAALISVEESAEKPELYHEVNATGTLNVLKASLEAGVEKLIYASSAAVYGEPEQIPVSEDHYTRPNSVYGATKLSGELYCRAFHKTYGISAVILRYFNVYGPGQSHEYAGVISSFLRRVSRGLPPVIYGDGTQTRDFIHVRDVARLNRLALNLDVGFGVYNVGSGRGMSILELAKLVLRMAGISEEPVFGPPRPGDIRHSVADISRVRRDLGFSPTISLEEGLRELLREVESHSPEE